MTGVCVRGIISTKNRNHFWWFRFFFVTLQYQKTLTKMNFKGTVVIKKEEDWFVATCLDNNVASQGKTIDEATENLKEAITLYYEDEMDELVSLPSYDQVYVTSLEMALV
jgi:predicted RNase H-like HicB family nuclease